METEGTKYTETHFQVEKVVLRIGARNRPIKEPWA